jgi:hypothetical protein
MSIYATLWCLKFPRYGDDHTGCEWVEVLAQGVPCHIGTPTPGFGYEDGDPYSTFLPPAVAVSPEGESLFHRAVVIVIAGTPKGTERSAQEYTQTLLVVSGEEYARSSFGDLHERICASLRSGRPRWIAESWTPDGRVELLFEDGSMEVVEPVDEARRRLE